MIEHCGIEAEVAFVGRGRSFQIWEPATFRQHAAEVRRRALSEARRSRPSGCAGESAVIGRGASLFEEPAGGHVPVLLREVLAALEPRADAIYVDGTFGAGGYSAAILATAGTRVWGIDRDPPPSPAGAPWPAAGTAG